MTMANNQQDTGLQIVTLSELKQQMRVEESYEDALITEYGKAAERYVITDTRRTLAELDIMGYKERQGTIPATDPGVQYFPAPLKVSILMLAAHLYRNREPVAAGVTPAAVPYTLEAFIKPYVRLTNDNSE